MAKARPLKLLAEDGADLQILSAALQDAIGRVGDFRYDESAKHFTAEFNRYQWEAAAVSGRRQRIRSALRIHNVLDVKSHNVKRDEKEAVVSLLAIEFRPDDEPPGGVVSLVLAGGGELRLTVDSVDAMLADVSAPWPTRRAPHHDEPEPGG